jgi:hypothetical protein
MPYYVYRVVPPFRLEKAHACATYKEASARAKALRAEAPGGCTVRLIFAENELQAEDLLSQPRAPEPLVGDDY